MHTTLDIHPDVLDAARRLAEARDTTVDDMVTKLLRRALSTYAQIIDDAEGFPVITPPAGTPMFASEDVRRTLDED